MIESFLKFFVDLTSPWGGHKTHTKTESFTIVFQTNASRKRRKLDADAPSFESEDNEYGKDTTGKEVESKSFESHREEFPKGKRKARKRRRLALKGRGIKDVRKQRKADALSYDDVDSFSSSSEASVFSDDETQGGGSEASASSDERGNVS